MKLRFKLGSKEKGLRAVFGELEAEIMDILWENSPLSGREIYEKVVKKKKVALTTVLTVLDRLSKKGYVEKRQGTRSTIFTPSKKREDFEKFLAKQLISSATSLSNDIVVSTFVDIFSRVDPKMLEKLSKIIEERLNEKNK